MSVSARRTVSISPLSTALRRSLSSTCRTVYGRRGMEEVLRKLAERLGPQEGEPQPLDGGITNRNYRVRFGATEYVVRLCGRETDLLGIDRDAEREAGEA